MAKRYEGPVNRISGPAIVMQRECHVLVDKKSRFIPVRRTLVEQRTGSLLLSYASNGLTIPGSETGLVYPNGATFNTSAGFELYVEVYPRKSTPEDISNYLRGSVRLVHMAPVLHTPLAIVQEASVYPQGGTLYTAGAHMTILTAPLKQQMENYLRDALPLIGVDPRDVDPVIAIVNRRMTAGKQRLAEAKQQLAARRRH